MVNKKTIKGQKTSKQKKSTNTPPKESPLQKEQPLSKEETQLLDQIIEKVKKEDQAAQQLKDSAQTHSITNMAIQAGDIKYLDAIVSEFLKCYIIIGYDLTGKKATISRITNQQDKDGLVEHLRTTFLSVIGQNPT